ncbi:MAG: BREX system P-loop protein BrxC, partial [Chromatiaceae bacterium]|nr:BREX system P-loop protein BrxC [Chromatiaceae bacterium]
HLQNTRLAATHNDDPFFVADYPLLPTRRRFWERVLRNTDHSGTKAQLRSQLQIVFEATQQTAAANLGTVVPADFIYDQIATDLLNSGELEREYDEIIRKQRDGTPDGQLRSSLCALIFLIGKLPRTPGADDGVRANAETLVDLLVGDLRTDRPRLEQQVPAQLQQLVAAGQLMAVEAEYRLQTREGALWTHDLNRRRTAALNDDQRINAKRAELLRDGTKQALKPVSLQQGTSRQPRKLACELSSSRPTTSSDEVTLWLRDGWSDDEKSVLNDARAAGVDSPLLFGYLPRLHHEELKQAIASHLAAQETLEAHGPAGTPEAIEARKAVETHLAIAQHRLQELLGHIIGGAKVFLGGGQEANGIELADKVQDSADSALVRLFPRFAEADHANWGQVVSRARGGDVGALAQVGYPGNPTQHPVCRRVLDLIGAGKKGKDIREHFKAAPFGWPQDAIDGALFVMLVAGNLRATNNGQPVQATLPQNQVGVAHFYVDVQPPDVGQRLNLKALFQKLGITTQNGKESEAAAEFLNKLLALAATAGGPAPRPETPATQDLRDLQMLSGNAQLLRLHELKDDLAAKLAAWKKSAEAISHRWPAWERLLDFHQFAAGLPAADACAQSLAAITAGRGLLADPDPVPELTKQLTTALRTALGKLQDDLAAAFLTGDAKLAASPVWNGRTAEQRATLASRCQLSPPPKAPIGTNDDILAALRARTLTDRRNLLDAVPQRFARALEEAAKLATPQAVRVALPSAIINDQAELDDWLDEVRQQVEDKLKDGPVIL